MLIRLRFSKKLVCFNKCNFQGWYKLLYNQMRVWELYIPTGTAVDRVFRKQHMSLLLQNVLVSPPTYCTQSRQTEISIKRLSCLWDHLRERDLPVPVLRLATPEQRERYRFQRSQLQLILPNRPSSEKRLEKIKRRNELPGRKGSSRASVVRWRGGREGGGLLNRQEVSHNSSSAYSSFKT